MLRSLFTGVTGLKAHQVRLDVVSNNIANVNTTGFKSSRVRFDDVLSQTIEIATAPESGRGGQNPKQIGLGVLGTTISRDMSQGAIEITSKTTDLAIQGNGFFILRDGQQIGEYYSRDGSFAIDRDGSLVMASNGFRVQGWNAFLDTKTQEMTINSSNPVEDIELDFSQQMAPVATSTATFGGNLDSRFGTALDPVRVGWSKNGEEREVEIRFTHVHPTEELYLWEVFDPSTTDPATGDFTRIPNDAFTQTASGIIELNETGQVVAHYMNVIGADTTDLANGGYDAQGVYGPSGNQTVGFLSDTEYSLLKPADGSASPWIYALQYSTRTFNGYDFFTLDTEGDGNYFQREDDARVATVTTSTGVITVTNTPLSSQTSLTGSAFNTTAIPTASNRSFANGGVFQTIDSGSVAMTNAGDTTMPGNGLGAPVEFIETISNDILDKRFTTAGGNTLVQLDHDLIVSRNRPNPTRDGRFDTTNIGETVDGADDGTDTDSLRLYIDGRQYTRVENSAAYSSASAAEFKLDAVNGIVEINGTISAGVNIIASYDHVIRSTNSWTASLTGVNATVANMTAGLLGITSNALGFNATRVDPSGAAVAGYDSSVFYRPGSGGTIQVNTNATWENYTEVPYQLVTGGVDLVAGTLGRNTYAINPETGVAVFGANSTGAALGGAEAVRGTGTNSSWTFEAYRRTRDNAAGAAITGLSNADSFAGDGLVTTANAHGFNDQWRVGTIPANGAETGQMQLWRQGDGVVAGAYTAPVAASLQFMPAISGTTNPRRAELNYESDDRVNIIIPNGLTKTPNIDPTVDKTPEVFSITPNTSQITANNGNNNQAGSGDPVAVEFKSPEEYLFNTAVQAYDSLGEPHNVTLSFEKLGTNRWLMTAIDPNDPNGTRLAAKRILAFEADGTYDQAWSIPYVSETAVLGSSVFEGIYFDPQEMAGAGPPQNGANPVQITMNFDNLFQTARGIDAVVTDQNGFPAGKLESFSFNDEGFLVGLFDNGRSMNLARVSLQGFVNPAGLVAVGGNMFKDTVNAGKYGSPQRPGFDGVGSIVPGALESSNVDLSVEFVDLIITQRGFQAQSRTITTADQVLQEVLSLKR